MAQGVVGGQMSKNPATSGNLLKLISLHIFSTHVIMIHLLNMLSPYLVKGIWSSRTQVILYQVKLNLM